MKLLAQLSVMVVVLMALLGTALLPSVEGRLVVTKNLYQAYYE